MLENLEKREEYRYTRCRYIVSSARAHVRPHPNMNPSIHRSATMLTYDKVKVRPYLMEAKVTLYAVGSEKHFPVAGQY